ncbi:MAG: sodium:proton antiporter NhaD [Rhodospirillales bacterium]|nr:sodium:proton antiporter NhaD [Rhodospirillales bacterium]
MLKRAGYFSLFIAAALLAACVPASSVWASSGGENNFETLSAVTHPAAIACLVIFGLSYFAVLIEEYTHLPKSKPVMLGAGLIWVVIASIAPSYNIDHDALHAAIFHGLDEYASLLLFLLAAMTYISTLEERNVFAVLKCKLVQAGFNHRQLFWATGFMAFFLSPIADNLTTALVLGAVVMAVGTGNPRFVALACLNIVSAANAGGAFSPFGDITTLMVWQSGHVSFFEFFDLFIPSLVCFVVPAAILSVFIDKDYPEAIEEVAHMKTGAPLIIGLGLFTIFMAVGFEQVLGLPPFVGMMTGLSLLMITAYIIRHISTKEEDKNIDVLENVALAEWDTLFFFFGVIFSVGGLSFLGYMELASTTMYDGVGASGTNIILGFASAIIDNIPVMFAVLSMNPDMDHFQWLLITLTTGVGGSMLSIGSAAGVALMGVARGQYTFMSHLKWAPVLLLGYAAAIGTHFLINQNLMDIHIEPTSHVGVYEGVEYP